MTDLSLVPLDDLVDEIKRRHDVVLLGLIQHENREDDAICVRWKGGHIVCIGLAEHMRHRLLDDFDELQADPE